MEETSFENRVNLRQTSRKSILKQDGLSQNLLLDNLFLPFFWLII
jgi:hypothetical protein